MNKRRSSPTATAITIVVAAIAAIGSLIGVLLANHSASENIKSQLESQSGVKEADLRREVYAEYAAAVMNFEATAGIQARLLATDKKELDPKTAEALVAVLNKFSRVMLIGSLAAIEKALNLMEDASNLATNIEHHHKDGASKSADQLNDHIVDFLNTVRPELKISSPLFSLPD